MPIIPRKTRFLTCSQAYEEACAAEENVESIHVFGKAAIDDFAVAEVAFDNQESCSILLRLNDLRRSISRFQLFPREALFVFRRVGRWWMRNRFWRDFRPHEPLFAFRLQGSQSLRKLPYHKGLRDLWLIRKQLNALPIFSIIEI